MSNNDSGSNNSVAAQVRARKSRSTTATAANAVITGIGSERAPGIVSVSGRANGTIPEWQMRQLMSIGPSAGTSNQVRHPTSGGRGAVRQHRIVTQETVDEYMRQNSEESDCASSDNQHPSPPSRSESGDASSSGTLSVSDQSTYSTSTAESHSKPQRKKRLRIKKKVGRFMTRMMSGSEDEEDGEAVLEAEVQAVVVGPGAGSGSGAADTPPTDPTTLSSDQPTLVETEEDCPPVSAVFPQSQTQPQDPPSLALSEPQISQLSQCSNQQEQDAESCVQSILQVFPAADEYIVRDLISQGLPQSTILSMVTDQTAGHQSNPGPENGLEAAERNEPDRALQSPSQTQPDTIAGTSSLPTTAAGEDKEEALARLHELFPDVDFVKKSNLLNRMALPRAIETLIEEAVDEEEGASGPTAAPATSEITRRDSTINRLHDVFPDVDLGLKQELLNQMPIGQVVEYLMEIQGN